jgi:hypothetical protein
LLDRDGLGADRRFEPLDLGAVALRVDLHEQIALLDDLPLLDRERDDLADDRGLDVDLRLGLDAAGRLDERGEILRAAFPKKTSSPFSFGFESVEAATIAPATTITPTPIRDFCSVVKDYPIKLKNAPKHILITM